MLPEIRAVILPKIIINISSEDQKLTLKEDAADSKIKKLHIKGLPSESLAFTLDYKSKSNRRCFQQLSCYLDSAHGKVNKSCDLVIISFINVKWRILILDMKSNKPDLKGVEEQLLNSEVYVQYLLSLIRAHYGCDTTNIVYQRTIITTGDRPAKKDAVYKPNDGRFSPKNYRIVPVNPKNQEAIINLGKLFDFEKLN